MRPGFSVKVCVNRRKIVFVSENWIDPIFADSMFDPFSLWQIEFNRYW